MCVSLYKSFVFFHAKRKKIYIKLANNYLIFVCYSCQVVLDDDAVKSEPVDNPDGVAEDGLDNKDALHQELGFDASDSMGADDDNYVDVDPSMLGDAHGVEDVGQAMPGSSGFQGVSFGHGALLSVLSCVTTHCCRP